MTKLDSSPLALTLSPASLSRPEPARRLIVLIPDVESDYTPAIRRVWELANASGGRVQFLGLCRDAAEEPSLRRGLVTMSALVGDGRVSAEARVVFGTDWVKAIKSNWQAGDVVVCFSEQRRGLLHRPLSQILESDLDAPVYVLSGIHPPERFGSNWLNRTIAWSGSIGIILGFFWLQIKIDQLAKDWAHSTLLVLSIPIEIGLILVWNSLFS